MPHLNQTRESHLHKADGSRTEQDSQSMLSECPNVALTRDRSAEFTAGVRVTFLHSQESAGEHVTSLGRV
ncbi:unnamed protein product [Boreogadus saida]